MNYNEIMKILDERFKGQDTLIALATISLDEQVSPAVRLVNSCYDNGSIYISSDATKNKSMEIEKNNMVSVCDMTGSNFTGRAEILGWVKDHKNEDIRSEFKKIFKWFASEGDEDNPNSIVIRIDYNKGAIFHNEKRYEIDFENKTACIK